MKKYTDKQLQKIIFLIGCSLAFLAAAVFVVLYWR